MRVSFVYMGAENLGLEYISGLLKNHGFSTYLVFDPALFDDQQFIRYPRLYNIFHQKKQLLSKIAASRPDLIAFSVLTSNYQWALGLAKEIKEVLSVPIIFGGIHPTLVPEKVIRNECVDMVCIGEGEYPMLELVNSLDSGKTDYSIKNIWFKKNGNIIRNGVRPLIQNLDSLPFLDKALFEDYIPLKDLYLIMTSRGCLYNCSYCCNNPLKRIYNGQKFLRQRSVDNVIEELRLMKRRYGIRSVYFLDNIFTADKIWLKRFCKIYKKEIGLIYTCEARASNFDEEIAKWLVNSGCVRVKFGIQTMNEDTRHLLSRYETNEQIEKALDICDKLSLNYYVDHIFGLPKENEPEQLKAVKFYSSRKNLIKINCLWLAYYPKTAVIDTACKLGIINERQVENEIEEGKERLLYHGGSLRDKRLEKVFRNFKVIFSVLPALPKTTANFIIKMRIYKYSFIMPEFVINILQAIFVPLIKRDIMAIKYVRQTLYHYLRNLSLKR